MKLIAGNWKMNGDRAGAEAYARALSASQSDRRYALAVCPPHGLIAPMAAAMPDGRIALGGQDCHHEQAGAFTGETSAALLADLGCRYVIVGHSERRQYQRENNALIRAKAEAAGRAGLIPILCVGETLKEREAGKAEAQVAVQIEGSVPEAPLPEGLVLAYEPVWAIGTGKTPNRKDIADMHGFIRAQLCERLTGGADVPILYGGSVKPANAAEILATPEVGGVLVGGASLNADDFLAIAAASPLRD